MAPSPLSPKPTQWSDSRRAARPQSPAASACRTASTRYPCSEYHPAAAACRPGHVGRGAAPQLQLQQVGEQLVVAEPGTAVHPARPRTCWPAQAAARAALRPSRRSAGRPARRSPVPAPKSAAAAAGLARAGGRAPRPAGTPPPSARCRRTRPRTGPDPGARPATAPPVAAPPPSPPCPTEQRPERRIGQRYPGRPEQSPRLLQGEAQVGRPDLGQLPFQPQPVQAQPQIMAGGQHEPQPRGRAHEQQLQLARRLGRAQLVHVVDHQPEPGTVPVRPDRSAAARPPSSRPDREPPSGAAPASTRRPCPAARRARTARTAAGRVLRPGPAPTRPAPPDRSRRSRSAAGASSRSRPRRHLGHAPGRAEQLEKSGPGHHPVPHRGSSRRLHGSGLCGRSHGALLDRPRPYLTHASGRESPRRVTPAHPGGQEP